ncbi:MAG: hypothetical protein AVDCRST_MAG89-4447, partial [uncultured Gemmatimonadetes bacterium]
ATGPCHPDRSRRRRPDRVLPFRSDRIRRPFPPLHSGQHRGNARSLGDRRDRGPARQPGRGGGGRRARCAHRLGVSPLRPPIRPL